MEQLAVMNGREICIEAEEPNGHGDFFAVINDEGTVGAFANIQDKGKPVTAFLILDSCKVKYCIDEGWELGDVYNVMGKKLFLEVTEDNFFEIMTERKSLDL